MIKNTLTLLFLYAIAFNCAYFAFTVLEDRFHEQYLRLAGIYFVFSAAFAVAATMCLMIFVETYKICDSGFLGAFAIAILLIIFIVWLANKIPDGKKRNMVTINKSCRRKS